MNNTFFSTGDVVVGVLFTLNGIIFLFQKPRAGKERQMRWVGFGTLIGGVLLIVQRWMNPGG